MKKIFISTLLLCTTALVFAETDTPTQTNPSKHYEKADLGSISWSRRPVVKFSNHDLKGQNRSVSIKLFVSETGKIDRTEIIQSSGLENLDRKVQRAVMSAKFKPYKINGIAYAFIAEQPFQLNSTDSKHSSICKYTFESETNVKRKFSYLSLPDLNVTPRDLKDQSRSIQFQFKLSKKHDISKVKVIKSSGLMDLDQKIITTLQHARAVAPRKFYQFYKLKFTDQIHFNLDDCE